MLSCLFPEPLLAPGELNSCICSVTHLFGVQKVLGGSWCHQCAWGLHAGVVTALEATMPWPGWTCQVCPHEEKTWVE